MIGIKYVVGIGKRCLVEHGGKCGRCLWGLIGMFHLLYRGTRGKKHNWQSAWLEPTWSLAKEETMHSPCVLCGAQCSVSWQPTVSVDDSSPTLPAS